jgi:NMD protein affecting ribosome stability and mRNA decay
MAQPQVCPMCGIDVTAPPTVEGRQVLCDLCLLEAQAEQRAQLHAELRRNLLARRYRGDAIRERLAGEHHGRQR